MDFYDLVLPAARRSLNILLLSLLLVATAIAISTSATMWLDIYEATASAIHSTEVILIDQPDVPLCLRTFHPTTLLFTPARTPIPIEVQLQPHACQSPTEQVTLVQPSQVANSSPFTYTIAIVADGARITNKEGSDVDVQLIYTSGHWSFMSTIFYLEQISPFFNRTNNRRVVLSLTSSQPIFKNLQIPLNLHYETWQTAIWRRVLQTFASNGAATVIALLPFFIAVFVTVRNERSEEWRRAIDELKRCHEEATQHRDNESKKGYSFINFIADYLNFEQKFHKNWVESHIRRYYHSIKEKLGPNELLEFLALKQKPQLDLLTILLLGSAEKRENVTLSEIINIFRNEFELKPEHIETWREEIKADTIKRGIIRRAFEWALFENTIGFTIKNRILHASQALPESVYNDLRSKVEQSYYFTFWKTWSLLLYRSEKWIFPSLWADHSENVKQQISFQAIRAEGDPLLFITFRLYNYKLPIYKHLFIWLQQVEGETQSCLVIGGQGSGKTAACILLVYQSTKKIAERGITPVSPVYWRYQSNMPSIQQNLFDFATILARALVGYLADQPDHFLHGSPARQNAIATLFAFSLDIEADFRLICTNAHFQYNKNFGKMFAIIKELQTKNDYRQIITEGLTSTQLLDLYTKIFFTHSHSDQLTGCTILIDVQRSLPLPVLNSLLQTITLLTKTGFVVKAFLPQPVPEISWFGKRYQICWHKLDLRALLKVRLAGVKDDTWDTDGLVELAFLCQRDVDIETLEENIYNTGQFLPGPVLQIMKMLVEKYEAKKQRSDDDPRLSEKEINEILSRFAASA